MKYNRLQAMEEYIKEHKSVSNEELIEKFNISIQTLRRDLKLFEDNGLISKVYGGVVYVEKTPNKTTVSGLDERRLTLANEKQKIGKLAASFVCDDDVIFVDSGTTTVNMIPFLKNTKNVVVISHCLEVMNALVDVPNVTGICAGGTLLADSKTFLIDTTFYPYNYNKAFISTVGISLTHELTNTNLQEGAVKRHIIKHAKEVYVLADHSKFGIIAFNHFANYNEVDYVITDKQPDDKYVGMLENNRIKVIY